MLLKEGVLQPMVGALERDDVNCQRFAALCLANLATTVASQVKVVQAGAILCRTNCLQAGCLYAELPVFCPLDSIRDRGGRVWYARPQVHEFTPYRPLNL